jgi:thioesterase domain-containing protein
MMDAPTVQDIYRLTPAQHLMLLYTIGHPHSNELWQQFACSIRGNLDSPRFREAWRIVLNRYAVFRTAFVWENVASPHQFVLEEVDVPWEEYDFRDLSENDRLLRTEELMQRDRCEAFDLSLPPLVRCTLIRYADDHFRMVWGCHHLVLDGWSLPIVLEDLFRTYDALGEGRIIANSNENAFRNYVAWLEDQDLPGSLEFWRERLAGYEPPAPRFHTTRETDRWHARERHLTLEQTEQVLASARNLHCSSHSIAVAALGLTMASRHHHFDIVLGTAVSGRSANLAGVDRIVGPLMNSLPLRLQFSTTDTVQELLSQIQQQFVEMQPHEYTPYGDIVKEVSRSGPVRLFDTLLVFENYSKPTETQAAAKLHIEDIRGTATSTFPITVVIIPDVAWTIRCRWNSSESTHEHAVQLLDTFIESLLQLAADPRQPLSSLSTISRLSSAAQQMDERRRMAERLLTTHNLVADSHVVCRSHDFGECELVLYVVPSAAAKSLIDRDGRGLIGGLLDTELRELNQAPGFSLTVVPVEQLTRDESGAVDERTLPAPWLERPSGLVPYVAPRDQLESALVGIWQSLLRVQPIGVDDPFMELGGDSVTAVAMLSQINATSERHLPMVALFQNPTIAKLAEMLRSPITDNVDSLVVPFRIAGSRTPLFCIHPAGGTVFCYAHFSEHLPPDRPLYGIQAVGLDGSQSPQSTVPEMAAAYVRAMQAIQPNGPYALCGWSSGGVLAYEVACQLQAIGAEVSIVALFDAALPDPDREMSEADFLPMLQMMFPGDDIEELVAIQQRSLEEQLAYFRDRAELAQVVLAGAGKLQLHAIYEVFQANVAAMTTYRPAPYQGRIELFRTQSETTPMHRHESLGWDSVASDIQVHFVSGDHVTMFAEPHIIDLAKRLGTILP